jgi:hypothetical protein
MEVIMPETKLEAHTRLAEAIEKLLAGEHPEVQGSILADLTATWLAGHRTGKRLASEKLREAMLKVQTETIRKLVPINLKIMEEAKGLEEEEA